MSKISDFIKKLFGQKPNQIIVVKTTKEPNYKPRKLEEVKKQVYETSEDVNPFEFPTKNKKPRPEFKKATKIHQVRLHLLNKGTIDSWTAIELYGATRLSAIIYKLRNRGMDITSIPCSALDRNSNVCNFTTYKLNQ
jgi:hypothetical protein